jgi:hypothetical protein
LDDTADRVFPPAAGTPDVAQPDKAMEALCEEPLQALYPGLELAERAGAHRFDPARFGYIRAMACKARDSAPDLAAEIERKALEALKAYRADFLRSRDEALNLAETAPARDPQVQGHLQSLLEAGDFTAMKRLAARDTGSRCESALATLADKLSHSTRDGSSGRGTRAPYSNELAALRRLRQSLGRVEAEKRVEHARREQPGDAGPLNPHNLIIRSLSDMDELSPAYLSRFIDQVDTLLWLERAGLKAGGGSTKMGPARPAKRD